MRQYRVTRHGETVSMLLRPAQVARLVAAGFEVQS